VLTGIGLAVEQTSDIYDEIDDEVVRQESLEDALFAQQSAVSGVSGVEPTVGRTRLAESPELELDPDVAIVDDFINRRSGS
jgi:hypothetical protein